MESACYHARDRSVERERERMANSDPPMNEQHIEQLESKFPAASGVAFSMAFQQAVDAGLRVLVSENDAIYEVFPDGQRQFVKSITPPIPAEPGQKISIP